MSRLASLMILGALLAAPAMADGHALRGGLSGPSPLSASCGVITTITHENGVRVMRSSQDPACIAAGQAQRQGMDQTELTTNVTVNVAVNEAGYDSYRRIPRRVPFYERFAQRWDR